MKPFISNEDPVFSPDESSSPQPLSPINSVSGTIMFSPVSPLAYSLTVPPSSPRDSSLEGVETVALTSSRSIPQEIPQNPTFHQQPAVYREATSFRPAPFAHPIVPYRRNVGLFTQLTRRIREKWTQVSENVAATARRAHMGTLLGGDPWPDRDRDRPHPNFVARLGGIPVMARRTHYWNFFR